MDRCYWYYLAVFLFIWGLSVKELASKNSLYEKKTLQKCFQEVEKTRIRYNLKWSPLRCVRTDSAKNTSEAEKGLDKFTKLIKI